MTTTKVECMECDFVGEIRLEETGGGMFFEDENRMHVTGDCPKCGINLINFHYTKKEKADEK